MTALKAHISSRNRHRALKMTLKKSIIIHPRLGRIIVTRNPRARNIIMRARPDAIHATIPVYATETDLEKALTQSGDKLLRTQEGKREKPINVEFSIEAPNFRLNVNECNTAKIKVTGYSGTYTLHCPEGTDYCDEAVQQTLRNGIKAAMKHCASIVLPMRLKALAEKHGFTYVRCTVRDVSSRWGSCTSTGNISLNIRLITLPDRLIDYVLLHELCHTVEMNHSDRFWALMDRHTAPARAKALRAELKGYNN